jgi:hypothetical protein
VAWACSRLAMSPLAVRVARTAPFRGAANWSSAGLAPHVEHRSPTAKRMARVHVWIYRNTGAASRAFRTAFAPQISDTEDTHDSA